MDKFRKLRELFANDKITRIMGAHNALGAKIIEKAGFDGVWASGLEISASYGVPDANILTMTDLLNAASAMNEAVSIPVIADCDTGFGNSNNVIHMVKKYEAAGIAAVCIEDKHFPKVNSLVAGRQELTSISEFVGKILAAKNAQTNKDFMVIARVEALIAGWGMDEAIRRAHAYLEAGADAILIHSKAKNIDEIKEFAKKYKNRAPLVVVPTTYFNINIKQLEKLKIKMVIYANQGLRASIRAMQEVSNKIYKDGTSAYIENEIASLEEVFDLQEMQKMKDNELAYSTCEGEKIVVVIPVAGDHLEEYSMKEISQDIPIAMLDINGKPLLQRQVEAFNRCKIYDIRVVGGYKKEKINVDGIRLISNNNYKHTGILYSIMCALKDITSSSLIIYGDILFDHLLVSRVFEKTTDITLVVDNTYNAKRAASKKHLELVVADKKVSQTKRFLYQGNLHTVRRIDSTVNKDETNLEFCGIMYLSQKGVKIIKNNYAKFKSKDKTKISLAYFLQVLINSGYTVKCLDVNSGWMEINSLEDYKLACSIFR